MCVVFEALMYRILPTRISAASKAMVTCVERSINIVSGIPLPTLTTVFSYTWNILKGLVAHYDFNILYFYLASSSAFPWFARKSIFLKKQLS